LIKLLAKAADLSAFNLPIAAQVADHLLKSSTSIIPFLSMSNLLNKVLIFCEKKASAIFASKFVFFLLFIVINLFLLI